jgi:beta-lactamase superfamily II metal-dependent hydrolase
VLRGLGDELSWHDRSIDLVILTHPQADHAVGLLDVFDRFDVHTAMAANITGDSLTTRAIHDAVDAENARFERARAGDSIDLGGGVRLDILSPDDALAADPDTNDAAVVVMLTYGDVRFLLTGDIEAQAERAIVAADMDLRATVLKVAHHGSRTSSIQPFVDAVRPQISIISAGRDNPFGHPAPEVVARLAAYGDVYSTADHGSIHLESDGHRLWIETSR